VVFILCTTEAQRSPRPSARCQRFDFRPIPTTKIAGHLKDVLKQESMADDELIHAVASGWATVDARLALPARRVIAALDTGKGEKKLTLDLLDSLLGLPDRALVVALIDAFADGDAAKALARTDDLLQKGIAIDQILSTLVERLRDLMILAACGDSTDLVDLSAEAKAEAAAQAGARRGGIGA
jgi:DNA polymerase-3 subunit gamma/tau